MPLVFELLHNLVGFLGHLFVDVLALLVISVDKFRLIERLLEVLFHEQVNSLLTVLYSSRGVDAWTYLEYDVTHGEFASGQSACLDDSLQADGRILVELLQPVECQCAVFARHRHYVRCDAHSTEVE